MPILGIFLVLITAFAISDKLEWNFFLALFPAIIAVGFGLFILNGLFNFSIILFGECIEHLKKVDKKVLFVALSVIVALIAYNSLFRYKYRTYKGNYNQVQVIKVDTLTGKSTVSYPEFVENKK